MKQAWWTVCLFWMIYFLNQADRQVIFSVMPLVKTELALDDALLGLFGSVFFWIYGILVPVAGVLGDSWSRKKIIVTALVVWSAATFSSGFAIGFLMLVSLRGLTAFGEAFYYPSANSILSDFHGTRTRATAMAIHQTSVYFGTVVSGAAAGWIGQTYGWRPAFYFFGGLGLVVAVLAVTTLKEPRRGAADQSHVESIPLGERIREMLACPTGLLLTAAFLGFILVNAAYLTWTPTLLYRKFGMSLAEAGFHATFWHHIGAAVGVLAGGKLTDHLAVRDRIWRPRIQVVGLLLGAPFIYLLGTASERNVVFAALTLFGVFRGLYDSNLFTSLYEVIRPASRATATGLMLAVAFLGGGFAPVIIGWLGKRFTLGTALAASSACYLFAAAAIGLATVMYFRSDARKAMGTAE